MQPLSRLEVIAFAAIRAFCRTLKPRERIAYLREIADTLEAWAEEPPSIRSPAEHDAKREASTLFRQSVARLLE